MYIPTSSRVCLMRIQMCCDDCGNMCINDIVSIYIKNLPCDSAVIACCVGGHIPILSYLIHHRGADLRLAGWFQPILLCPLCLLMVVDGYGKYPFLRACSVGNIPLLDWIVSQGIPKSEMTRAGR